MKATINLEFTDEELRHHLADMARRLVFDSIGDFFNSFSIDPQTMAALNHGMQHAFASIMQQHQQRPRAQTGPVQVPWGSPGWMAPGPGAPPWPGMAIPNGVPGNVRPIREPAHLEKCFRIEATNHIEEGWGCHMCATYNGVQRTECRVCGHARCGSIVTPAPQQPPQPPPEEPQP